MVREGQKRGNTQYGTEIDNGGRKVQAYLGGTSFHPSLSGERDDDKQQTDQGRGCRRREEIEIRPSLELIHRLTALSLLSSSRSHSATRSATFQRRSVTPTAIAGIIRSVR